MQKGKLTPAEIQIIEAELEQGAQLAVKKEHGNLVIVRTYEKRTIIYKDDKN